MNKICPRCNKNFDPVKLGFDKRRKYCSDKCSNQHSKKTREQLSKKRIKYLKENPDKHPWRNKNKQISVPCEKVKKFLSERNIKFIEEYQPLKNRFFSIDIAFPDIKLGIEINGNQHYNRDGTLKEYYQKRHNLLLENGWNILELHYSISWNLDKLEKIISKREQPDYSNYLKEQFDRKNKNKNKSKKLSPRQKADIKWEPYKEKILTSNIDFSKFGWVNEASKILGISPSKVNWWMKRYLPNFYENNCFKRKKPS
jgi:very-short-patch-repair endonuclease